MIINEKVFSILLAANVHHCEVEIDEKSITIDAPDDYSFNLVYAAVMLNTVDHSYVIHSIPWRHLYMITEAFGDDLA